MCKPVKTVFGDLQPKRNKRASWLELVAWYTKKEEEGFNFDLFFSLDNFVKISLNKMAAFGFGDLRRWVQALLFFFFWEQGTSGQIVNCFFSIDIELSVNHSPNPDLPLLI